MLWQVLNVRTEAFFFFIEDPGDNEDPGKLLRDEVVGKELLPRKINLAAV